MLRWQIYVSDTRGGVTFFAVVTFAFLMGFSGLIFDAGRVFNLHSQAQAYADQTALASAAELDGETGSIARAVRAVNTTDANSFIDPGFRLTLSQDPTVNIYRLTFLSAIGPDPAPGTVQPVAGDAVLCSYQAPNVATGATLTNVDCVAADDAEAAFVLVTTTLETENFVLFPLVDFLAPGIVDQASTATQALAGFTREICNFPPMAICNPDEDPVAGGGGFTAQPGQQILLRTQGPSSSWAPGNFGFLDLTDDAVSPDCSGGGANFLKCVLASINPNTQCTSADVDFQPGEIASADVGINVRFDIFDAPLHNDSTDPGFAPDVNVTKGFKRDHPTKCRKADLTDVVPVGSETVPLPTDVGISATNRIGVGVTVAQLEGYWAANHDGDSLPGGITTRYQAYLHEIANTIPNKSPDGENGNPTCAPVSVTDRRRLIVAVVNCVENGVSGSSDNVPVITFLEMFLTQPVGLPGFGASDIYAEVISTVTPGGNDGVLHEYPVLYR